VGRIDPKDEEIVSTTEQAPKSDKQQGDPKNQREFLGHNVLLNE
jgi:hypothetical protein